MRGSTVRVNYFGFGCTKLIIENRSVMFSIGGNSVFICQLRSFPVLHCASLLRIISRVISTRELKKATFSLRLDLATEVNRHFLENEYGDLSFFFCCFELSNTFLYVK